MDNGRCHGELPGQLLSSWIFKWKLNEEADTKVKTGQLRMKGETRGGVPKTPSLTPQDTAAEPKGVLETEEEVMLHPTSLIL